MLTSRSKNGGSLRATWTWRSAKSRYGSRTGGWKIRKIRRDRRRSRTTIVRQLATITTTTTAITTLAGTTLFPASTRATVSPSNTISDIRPTQGQGLPIRTPTLGSSPSLREPRSSKKILSRMILSRTERKSCGRPSLGMCNVWGRTPRRTPKCRGGASWFCNLYHCCNWVQKRVWWGGKNRTRKLHCDLVNPFLPVLTVRSLR